MNQNDNELDFSLLPDQPKNNFEQQGGAYSGYRPPTLAEVYWDVAEEEPERAAQVVKLARHFKQPITFVDSNLESMQRAAQAPTWEFWNWFEQAHPVTATYLSDPQNMASAKDVVEELGFFEKLINSAKTGFQAGEMNVEYSRLAWQQLTEALRTGKKPVQGEERLQELERLMQGVERPEGINPLYFAGEQLPNMLFMAEQALKRGLPAAGGSALGALVAGQLGPQALVPEEAVTVPGAALTGLAAGTRIGVAEASAILEGGAAFREFMRIKDKNGKPINPRLAAEAAIAVGLINAGLEYASMSLLLKTIPGGQKILDFLGRAEIKQLTKKQTGKRILTQGVKRYLQSIVGEVGTEMAQEAVTAGTGQMLRGEGRLGDVLERSLEVVSPTVQSSMIFGLPGLGAHTVQGLQNVRQAKVDAEVYKVIGEAAANSKYLERLPEGWRQLVEANVKDGKLENIYIDTEPLITLFQKMAPEVPGERSAQIVAEELGIGDQLQEALDTGKPLKIPYAVWLEKVAKTPIYKQMEQHIKFSEDGLTLAQAAIEEETINKRIAEEQRQAEELIQRHEELKRGREFVYKDIKDRLLAAGRPENISKREWPAYVDRAARLWAAHAATEAAKRGITVEEWYQGANRPSIVKADFMPADIGPEIRAKLDEREREFLDILAERDQSIEAVEREVEAEYNRILQDQIDYLEQSGGKGVEQGYLIKDEVTGEVVGRVGRQSKNPLWYREFFAAKGRAPSKRELRELALKQLREGYADDTAEIPANLDFIALENTLQRIRNLRSKIAAAKEGVSYKQEDIYNIPEIIAAQKAQQEYLDKNGPTININTPERWALREKIANKLYGAGAKNKEKKAVIVLGLPASGKSKAVAEPLAKKTGSLIIDSDLAKEDLPEYDNGKLAGAVHIESDLIGGMVLDKALKNNDNIVLPLVGRNIDKIRALRDRLLDLGYTVDLKYVDLPVEEAISRAVTRYFDTGRFVDPAYVESIGLQPRQNYDILKLEKGWASYEAYSTDVAKGEPPRLLESGVAGRGQEVGYVDRSDRQNIGRTGDTNSRTEKIEPNRSGNQGDSYFQSAPPFYSKLERFIEGQKQETFSADQLRGMLGKAGIKEDELKWTGIMSWLEGKKKVTKAEVLDYLRTDGAVRIEVVLKRQEGINKNEINWSWIEEDNRYYLEGEWIYIDRMPDGIYMVRDAQDDSIIATYDNLNDAKGAAEDYAWRKNHSPLAESDPTKYSKYVVPGGKNYTEILLTLPIQQKTTLPAGYSVKPLTDHPYAKYMLIGPDGIREFLLSDTEQEAIIEANSLLDRVKPPEQRRKGDVLYKSSHWDEPNVLAHIRATERTDAEGAKVLFVEEFQSDWGQEGKKRGFKGVPLAPFVTSTDKWLTLALKHAIRYAAENGFDKIAWARGEQNAEHYDLSKQVDEIVWTKNDQGKYKIEAYRGNSDAPVFYEINIDPDRLADYIGKDLAEKIIADKSGSGAYKGLDLKIGGAGMKAFYDQIVPQTVLKFVRQFDKDAKLETVNIGHGPQQGFTVPDKLRDVALYEGFPLFQSERGFIQFREEGPLIGLLKSADASTFLHESAHLFLDDMFKYVRSGQADEKYLADWSILAQWLEIKDDQESLTTEQQEKFARGFERYLMEGKSPSEGLRKVFSMLRKWLVRIYRDIAGLNVEISDEVRGVMDRMLATEEEIREREAYNGYLDDVIKEGDVSPETWQKLQDLKERAHEMAVEQLLKPQMDELKPEHEEWLQQERERVRKIIEEEVAKLPIYRVMEAVRMTFGRNKDVKDIARRYLNKAEGITNEGIAKFELIADSYGYSSGDHLAREIVFAPLFVEEVNDRLNIHMAQYADLKDSMEIKYEAEKAVRNNERLTLMALERSILLDLVNKEELSRAKRQRALERARIAAAAARRYARAILADKPYREAMAATSYFAAERNAAVKEAGHYNAKDYEKAAKYAEQKILNHALAVEALRVKDETTKIFKYLERFQKRGAKLPKMPYQFVLQIDALLERFGLSDCRALKNPEREPLADFIKQMADDYQIVPIAEDLLAESWRKDYKDLTLGELRNLYNAVRSIATLGYNWNRFLSEHIKADLDAAAAETAASIRKNLGAGRAKDKQIGSHKTWIEKLAELPDDESACLLKMEFIARALDGNLDGGPMQRYFISLFSQAWNKEAEQMEEVIEGFSKLISKYYTREEMVKTTKSLVYIPAINRSLTKEERLFTLLNWGNEGGRDRIMSGYGLSEEQIKAIIDTLDKKDLDLAQDIWDYLDTFWPDIKKLEIEVAGVEPEKVAPAPVETKFGTYRGGYFPLAYDPKKSADAAKHDEMLNALYKENPAAHAATRHGFTKARVTHLERPVYLSWNVLTSHLVNVVHDLTHRKAIIDANRFLKHKDVKAAITDALGVKVYRSLENAIKAVASDQGEHYTNIEKKYRWFRRKTTTFVMGMKMSVAILQLIGYFQTAWEIGTIPTLKGIVSFAMHPQLYWNFVSSKSVFMRNRAKVFDRDIYDFSRRTFKGDNDTQAFMFAVVGFCDLMVSAPTWLQAYKIGMEKFAGDEVKAVEYADGVVIRTQGSGAVKDLAEVQRGGELRKLGTMFYSFGNVLFNRYWLASKEVQSQIRSDQKVEAIKTIAYAVAYGWLLPGIFEALVREAIRNSRGDDDDDERWKRFCLNALSGPLQTIPVVRDLGGMALNALFGEYVSFRFSPIESTIQNVLGGPLYEIGKALRGEGDWGELTEKIIPAAGFLTGIPQQIVNTAQNFLDWLNDEGELTWQDIISRRVYR